MKSIESIIELNANKWLDSYGVEYKMKNDNLNEDIDNALKAYESKTGKSGGNYPDVKLLKKTKEGEYIPVLIEYKGKKGDLEKLDDENRVLNKDKNGKPLYNNIRKYAVNGAIHYSNAILHYTNYEQVIAIGVNGYKDGTGNIIYEISSYYVSKDNLGIGQKIGDYEDLSFLSDEFFDNFMAKVKTLNLTEDEKAKIREKYENEIDASLKKLNNDIYSNTEWNLTEKDRMYVVAASIIASKGIPNKVSPLKYSELKSLEEKGNRDGDIILRKVDSFFSEQELPNNKKDFIIRTFSNVLLTDELNFVKNGESQIKQIYKKVIDDLGLYYKVGLTTDFTGKLFNEMYSWLGYSQDKLNDVVLTPYYVANLLVDLAKVNKDSHVWDFTTGSGGLLVAAMNKMIEDAKKKIKSPLELGKKIKEIKTKQILGIEILPEIYTLAVLNVVLTGGSADTILNKDSLKDIKEFSQFKADAFVLNPPYSEEGKGMIFVERSLNIMNKGYAAIIIQNSAGSGKAKEFNKRILKRNTLIASIKMPNDLFLGKAAVQTNIYVFKVGEAHDPETPVKFIDFSNDGYKRTARKKSSINLEDVDNAKERYKEIVKLVHFGKSKLKLFTEKEYYENTIDPESGEDWNQSAPIDTKPTLEDFQKTISDYLSWEISTLLKDNTQDSLGK